MKNLFVCMSHTLTPDQEIGWDIVSVVSADLKKLTSQVSPDATLLEIKELAEKVVAEAIEAKATHILVAGEPTLMLHANLLAHKKGLNCVQSTTRRDTVETPQADGSVVKTQIFRHVQWREMF